MTKKKPRRVKINTQLITSTGLANYDEELLVALGVFLEGEDYADDAIKEILAVVQVYNSAVSREKTIPSITKQNEDLRQLAEALQEVEQRFFRYSVPLEAQSQIDDILKREHGTTLLQEQRDILPRLATIRKILGQIDLSDVTQTNPGKGARDTILIPDLIQIFEKYIGVSYGQDGSDEIDDSNETTTYRRKDTIKFIELVCNTIDEPLPTDLPRLIRQIHQA